MSETIDGVEIARVILGRGTTAAQVAEMDLETLTQTVAYRRKRKVAPGAIDPALTDEQLARAILEYAKSEPVDWPVPPGDIRATRGGLLPILFVLWPIIGLLGHGTGLFLAAVVGDYQTDSDVVMCVGPFSLLVLGAFGGLATGVLTHRWLQRAIGQKSAMVWATVCTVVVAVSLGFATVPISIAVFM